VALLFINSQNIVIWEKAPKAEVDCNYISFYYQVHPQIGLADSY
jgi:hypothetical protein